MRNTLIILMAGVFQLYANNSYSQNTVLSLDLKNTTVANVLESIEKNSEFYFLYNSKLIDVNREVSISVQNEKISDILTTLFAGTEVNYKVFDKQIILSTSGYLNALPDLLQQELIVKGKVTDSSTGDPMIGVNIVIKGLTKGTTTDISGNYSISVMDKDAILVFSFISYATQEISLNGRTTLDVGLVSEVTGLEEVVVIGYGIQKKVNLTGSVAVGSKELFENKTAPNAVAAIQGTLPGLLVTRSSGTPGLEGFDLQIRGLSSINSVGVLVLVDGVQGTLSEINPNDIQSISVLKDAAASSIYGSNAAGGVVLITTKKGQKGRTVVDFNSMFGMTHPGRMPHSADWYNQFRTIGVAFRNAGIFDPELDDPVELAWFNGERLDEPNFAGAVIQHFPTGNFFINPDRPNVWQSANSIDPVKEWTKKYNPVSSHNLSISGGNDNNTYLFSAGYYNRRGFLRYGPDSNERYNIRLNTENKLNKFINLNTSIALINRNIYAGSDSPEDILQHAYRFFASAVTYGPDGEYFPNFGLFPNYVQIMKEGGENTRKSYGLDAKMDLKIENILKGLTIDIVGSKSYTSEKQLITIRTLEYIGPLGYPVLVHNPTNFVARGTSFNDFTSLQAYATYNFNINDIHNFTLMGGYSWENFRMESFSTRTNNLTSNDFFSLNWGDATTKSNSDNIITWATLALFGRLNYNFREKYLIECNLRYDASSRLAPENRWNLFPSFSAGWNLSNEEFLKGVQVIEDIKLRASWGQLGNSNALGYYDYIGLLNVNNNLPLNDSYTSYTYQSVLASPSKTWETIETTNIGLDFSVLNKKLSFTADAYLKKNKNMLVGIQVPSLIGIGIPSYNAGELETKGWEVEVKWKEMSRDFNYWISLNLSDNTNKLVKYEGRSIVTEGLNSLIEGLPVNTIWGYKTDGLFMSDQEYAEYDVYIDPRTGGGDMKYLDLNGDKKINVGEGTLEDHGDLVRLGDTNPRYMFGINLGFQWKGLDFSSFLQGVGKRMFNMFSSSTYINLYSVCSDAVSVPFKEQLDYWTPENTDSFWPRPFYGGLQSYWPSDYWTQNGAYLRLKNITLGYSLPQTLTQKIHITKARVFIQGDDLWEATKTLSYIDPEAPENASFIYPFYRSVSIGLNITF